MKTEQEIWEILSKIPDPEIPVINIVELGILRSISIENEDLKIVITPTYSGCPAMNQIEDDINQMLNEIGINHFEIKVKYKPAWTTDWLTEEAKAKLLEYGISPPLSSSKDKSKITGKSNEVICPNCKSYNTELVSQFGSTACKALYKCTDCLEPFDYFKCI